jgi:hypothetical protein
LKASKKRIEDILNDSKKAVKEKKIPKRIISKKSASLLEMFCLRLRRFCNDIELRNPIIMVGYIMERQ